MCSVELDIQNIKSSSLHFHVSLMVGVFVVIYQLVTTTYTIETHTKTDCLHDVAKSIDIISEIVLSMCSWMKIVKSRILLPGCQNCFQLRIYLFIILSQKC